MNGLRNLLISVQDNLDRLLGRQLRPLALSAVAISDRGLVRADNQDSYAISPTAGFLCVADGMGGGEDGALASRWTCDELQQANEEVRELPLGEREKVLLTALQRANDRIRGFAHEHGYRTMGTTVVTLLLEPRVGNLARVFHVGDSRLYRLRRGRLDQITRDHTVGNELGKAMTASSAEQARDLQARSNPLTHILTRAIGVELKVRPEWKTVDIHRGDRLLLCSDGVHDMLSDARIAEVLGSSISPRVAAERLATAVRDAGAGDNYTIVCADVVKRR